MIGLTGFGGYIPRLRLARQAIAEANGWIQPGLRGLARGERSICNWDEDSVTMAVEAARDCLGEDGGAGLRAIYLGSTTLPFQDRQNAGIVAAALNLDGDLSTMDVTSSQRAGTTALAAALDAVDESEPGHILVLASDARRARAAAQQEMIFGDGAAAFTVGHDGVLAELLARHSVAVDFVDHYRGENRPYDYTWEERWIRDEGFLKIMPKAVTQALDKAGVAPAEVDLLIAPSSLRGVPAKIAKAVDIDPARLGDDLQGAVGQTGCAHPLVMLSHALEDGAPGQVMVVASFGQGCDVLVFRATEAIGDRRPALGISGHLARRRGETNYNKFMAFNDLVVQEKGMRAELDNQTALTQLYRRRDMLLGLVGGECQVCGTRQFPRSRVCVNPNCNATNTQQPFPFSGIPASIMTWSADHL
ncbi:MAG: 3-hydroxy-3-methylglutaryl CoA synthase, partial [Hyphomicrobiales bacterium]|nr:3-hydroxy-3-methylglutaryl CoA synthase [Hyphomicrobiales bacterium]